jgi:hypothetical protein
LGGIKLWQIGFEIGNRCKRLINKLRESTSSAYEPRRFSSWIIR